MTAGAGVPGTRVGPFNTAPYYPVLHPGEYGLINGHWYGCTPNGLLANLSRHTVTEHEDGTISVSPSILVEGGQTNAWHGYLEHGVWRECW